MVFCLNSTYLQASTDENLGNQFKNLRTQIKANDEAVDEKVEYYKNYFAQQSDNFNESAFLNALAYKSILKLDLESTYENLLKARSKANLSDNKPQLAESYRLEGSLLDIIGEYGAALEALNKAFTLYNELQSQKVLSAYASLANVYVSLKDYPALLENSYKQLDAAQANNNLTAEALAYFSMAYAQSELNQLQDATVNATIAESLLKQVDYPFIGIIYLLIAQINVAQGNFEQGLKRISQSIKADRKVNFLQNEVPRLILLAEIYHLEGDTDKAIAELKKGIKQDSLRKDKIQFLGLLEKLITLTELSGDTKSQLKFLKQYNDIYKKNFNQKQAQMLAINNVRHNLFEKEKEIKLLQKENEIQLQKNLIQDQNNRYQLYFTLTIFVILVLVFALLIRTRKQRAELNRYSQELQDATQAKSDFLARMSHEIRTPINAISGLTKLMQKNADSPEDITNLEQIDEASHSLLGIINDILDFSKIEAGKLDLENTSFQLDKTVSLAIRLQSIKAHQKNIELIQHIARDVPLHLRGDGLRIQQVLINLLSNAVKFTDDGLVSVTVKSKNTEQGMWLEFAVKDTGIGLTQNQMDGLFESFAQVDESISRKYGGTGLGLAICKQLVELMGGTIWVKSQVGAGSTFYFTLPMEEDKTQQINSPSKQLSSLKVLVADDINLSRQVIAEALQNANIKADLAAGGQETLNKLRLAASQYQPYDVLILDWKMPDIDGLQVAAIINQEFDQEKPKIIMLSAFDFSQMQQQAKHLGIKNFIEKPFSASELIDKLQEVAFNIKTNTPVRFTEMENVPDLSAKHILLAEDNKLNQKVAIGFLKYTKAKVTLVEDGLAVIQALRQQQDFDCILMDLQMPEMDGLTATLTLRNELNCHLPIIAMTANAMKQDIEKSAAAGMTAHITKPIDPEYFYQVLAEILLTNTQAHPTSLQQPELITKDQSPSIAMDSLVTMDQQGAMQKLFIDEETFIGMLNDFIDKESTIKTLGALIENNDYQNIYKLTHDALPAMAYIGANNLAKLAKSIEATIYNEKQSSTPGFDEQLALFNQAMLAIIEKIKKQLANN